MHVLPTRTDAPCQTTSGKASPSLPADRPLPPPPLRRLASFNFQPPQDVRAKFGDDWERIARMSIIEESPGGEK